MLQFSAHPYVPFPLELFNTPPLLDSVGLTTTGHVCPAWAVVPAVVPGGFDILWVLQTYQFSMYLLLIGVLCSPLPNQCVPLSLTHWMASQQSILNAFHSHRVIALHQTLHKKALRHLSQIGCNNQS
jgi:hypothetical protein